MLPAGPSKRAGSGKKGRGGRVRAPLMTLNRVADPGESADMGNVRVIGAPLGLSSGWRGILRRMPREPSANGMTQSIANLHNTPVGLTGN